MRCRKSVANAFVLQQTWMLKSPNTASQLGSGCSASILQLLWAEISLYTSHLSILLWPLSSVSHLGWLDFPDTVCGKIPWGTEHHATFRVPWVSVCPIPTLNWTVRTSPQALHTSTLFITWYLQEWVVGTKGLYWVKWPQKVQWSTS